MSLGGLFPGSDRVYWYGLILGMLGSGWVQGAEEANRFDPTHARWTRILQSQVRDGSVDYSALKASPGELETYLKEMGTVSRETYDAWSEPQQIAFLINLYNAATFKLVLDHYPVASIKKIGGLFGSPWRQKMVPLWGETVTLGEVEHGILRKDFTEPRIHFALVCGARGCPPLRTEAYVGDRLDAQLEEQGRKFLADTTKNRVEAETRTLWLSPIFKWFAGDFAADGLTVGEYVEPFLPGAAKKGISVAEFKVRYTDYDWSLNER